MKRYWLDVGSGMDAEHWSATAGEPGLVRVAMDPLLTSGMVGSGRLAELPPDIRRVGGEVRPPGSLEVGKRLSFLPFRSEVFEHVHCGFVLHLYLEVLSLLAVEMRRVVRPGGSVRVLLPHFGESRSEQILRDTHAAFRTAFGEVTLGRHGGPFTTFWGDLYRDKVWEITAWRRE